MYSASDPAQVRMDDLAADRREATVDELAAGYVSAHADFNRAVEEVERLGNILRATAEGLRLPADGDPNTIPAAAAAAHDAARNLRVQLDRCNAERQRLAEELAELRASLDDELAEVAAELRRQDEKWGEQNHPNGTGGTTAEGAAEDARRSCNEAFARGAGTWAHILHEEVWEAFAEDDPAKLRAELVQVAAVGVQWMKAIKRRVAAAQAGENRG